MKSIIGNYLGCLDEFVSDVFRFSPLFRLQQWANSLCQGANLPLPVPLKVSNGFTFCGFLIIVFE